MARYIKRPILMTTFIVMAAAAIGVFLLLNHADATAPETQNAPQAMPVKVSIVEKEPLRLWRSYSGRLAAVDFVELRPQVDGRIDKIKFEDGAQVKKGDVLFVIDPRPYEANMAEAEAALAAAKSQQELAIKELERAQGLIRTEAISQRTLDERQNAASVAKNALNAAQAMVKKAQINLDHAYMKAPISGRVSRAEITVGNLVQTGPNAPVLTTIVSDEGIYADFEIDEQTYLKNIRDKTQRQAAETNIPVQLVLNGGSIHKGYIRSFDNRIDTSTGTIRARAYFENEDGTLLPGMYVTVKLGSPSTEEVILLTEQAIATDQDRKFVYIVGEDNKVAYRVVTLGASVDGKRIITEGLSSGERVITENTMKIMPDMPVIPQVAEAEQPDATQAPAESALSPAAPPEETSDP